MKKFFHAFGWALQGIWQAFLAERNMKIHFLATVTVIFAGWYFHVSAWQWLVLLLTIGLVLICEMFNTAIERVVDLCTSEYHPLAASAKNIAAGGVLIAAVIAVVIGGIIFLPYLSRIF